MKFALRDDDTCFYTRPEELEAAFADLEGIPISLSVVPYAVYSHAGTYPYGEKRDIQGYADIADNAELVQYLKAGVKNGRYEILQHGIHHEYFADPDGRWRAETEYFDADRLTTDIDSACKHLETTLDVSVTTFVAPSNAVSKECAKALDQLGLNTNYTIARQFSRGASIRYLRNYVSSNLFRALYGARLCTPLQYRRHAELTSFDFKSEDDIRAQYEICKRFDYPLVIYTHYWDLLRSPQKKAQLVSFVTRAVQEGAKPVFISECFQKEPGRR